eukprot:1161493-Pelagomonas_calceolata.AAC.3
MQGLEKEDNLHKREGLLPAQPLPSSHSPHKGGLLAGEDNLSLLRIEKVGKRARVFGQHQHKKRLQPTHPLCCCSPPCTEGPCAGVDNLDKEILQPAYPLSLLFAEKACVQGEGLRAGADNLNKRHRNAQMAGRASVELHTLIFFKDRTVHADARVTKAGQSLQVSVRKS